MALLGGKKRRKYRPRRPVTPESVRARLEAVKYRVALNSLRRLKDDPEVGKELVRVTYGIHVPPVLPASLKKNLLKVTAEQIMKIIDSDPALREGPRRRQIEERMRDQGLSP